MGLDGSLRSKIVEYNKSNDQYRIQVVDYSEYATDDDYNAVSYTHLQQRPLRIAVGAQDGRGEVVDQRAGDASICGSISSASPAR